MEYQYDISERKFTILFDYTQQHYIMPILELIKCKFCVTRQLGYLILIEGLESTMDDFIESCSSKNFFIHDNGKQNFLSKKLPILLCLHVNGMM